MKKTKKIPKKKGRTVPKLLSDLRASVASLSGEAAADRSEPAQESEVEAEEDDNDKQARTADRREAATPAVVAAAFDAAVSRAVRRVSCTARRWRWWSSSPPQLGSFRRLRT